MDSYSPRAKKYLDKEANLRQLDGLQKSGTYTPRKSEYQLDERNRIEAHSAISPAIPAGNQQTGSTLEKQQFMKSATGPTREAIMMGHQSQNSSGKGSNGSVNQQRFTNPTRTLEKMDEREPEEFKTSANRDERGHYHQSNQQDKEKQQFRDSSSHSGSEGSNAPGNKQIKSILSRSSGGSVGSQKSKTVVIDPEVLVYTIHNQQSSESENQPGKSSSDSSSSSNDSSSQSSIPSNSPRIKPSGVPRLSQQQQQSLSQQQITSLKLQQARHERQGSNTSVQLSAATNKNKTPAIQMPQAQQNSSQKGQQRPATSSMTAQQQQSQNMRAASAQSQQGMEQNRIAQVNEVPQRPAANREPVNGRENLPANPQQKQKNQPKTSCTCTIYQTSFSAGVVMQLVC